MSDHPIDRFFGTLYRWGVYILWPVSFLGGWWYAVAREGFVLGLTLGWIAASITACIVAFGWPLWAVLLLVLVLQ